MKNNMTKNLTLIQELLTAILFFAITLSTSTGAASCLLDYHIRQKTLAHDLAPEHLKTLDQFVATGNPAGGWKFLGLLGDSYAAVAAKVLAREPQFPESFYKKLIATHWVNSNDPEIIKGRFLPTAQQHFRQYVEILHSGYWPDSDQILMSYIIAVRNHGLTDVTVFDAAWDAAGLGPVKSWQSLNHLGSERTIFPTRACFEISPIEAREVLGRDFVIVPLKFILNY